MSKSRKNTQEEKSETQQYLNPFEEKAVVEFILQMAGPGAPFRVSQVHTLYSLQFHSP
jgi:hypothetical protein